MSLQTTNEPVLLYQDAAALQKTQTGITNVRPLFQAVIDAYDAVSGLPALTNDSFQIIFNDVADFVYQLQVGYYNTNWAEKHQDIGIDFETGFNLVKNKLPDMSAFTAAVENYFTLQRRTLGVYVGNDFFSLTDGELEVNQARVDLDTASNSLYLTYDQEIALKAQTDAFLTAFNGIKSLVPDTVINLLGSSSRDMIGFNALNTIFSYSPIWNSQGDFNLVYRMDFFKKFKRDLMMRNGLQ